MFIDVQAYMHVITRSFILGYFGNLYIFVDPIIFSILFFPNMQKWCCIITYMGINVPICLKDYANWTITMGPAY